MGYSTSLTYDHMDRCSTSKRSIVSTKGYTVTLYLALVGVVGLDVPDVMPRELVNGRLNDLDTAGHPHPLGRKVCVGASAVPVARHGFGVKGYNDPKVLGDPLEKVAGHPEVITHVNTLGGANLGCRCAG